MSAAPERAARRGNALTVLLGWVVSIALILLALEGILRLCGIRPVVTINEPDRELGWVKRAGESTRKKTGEYDVTFSINSLGMRGPETSRAKPAGTRRVLFLGDSFVLGYTVDPHDHFVDLAGAALRADRPDVETLNGGTEGWSTDQEVLWLRQQGLALAPDVVVACFFQNDVFGNGQSRLGATPKPRFGVDGRVEPASGAPPPRRGWLTTHTAIGALPEVVVALGAPRLASDESVVLREPPPALAYPDCWARTEACFRELKKTCDEAGAKLLLVAIPAREEVEPGAKESFARAAGVTIDAIDPATPVDKALAAAGRAGVATLDPRPALRAAAADGTKLYFTKDWHVNPAGSRVLGRAIYEELAKPAWLDGGTSAAGLAVFDAPRERPLPRWPFVVGAIWLLLSTIYALSYRDESRAAAFVKVGAMIGVVVLIVLGFAKGVELLGPTVGRFVGLGVVAAAVGWLGWMLLPKLAIIREVYAAFVRRGKWYMVPLLVVMLSIGGLLVVASSSPFIAPFIYTLF